MAKVIAKFFAKQAPIVAARVKARYVAAQKEDDLGDWDGLISIVTSPLEEIYKDSATESLADLGRGTFDQLNERAAAYARERAAELVGRRYDENGELVDNPNAEWTITEPTRDAINREVTKALEEGLSPDDLADAIDALIDDEARAELIADTELADAQSASTMDTWRESGVVNGKGWLLSDDNPCDICEENEAVGVIGIDETFPSGDDAPTAHPRCNCDLYATVDGEEE